VKDKHIKTLSPSDWRSMGFKMGEIKTIEEALGLYVREELE
jgi:hypothetical protein